MYPCILLGSGSQAKQHCYRVRRNQLGALKACLTVYQIASELCFDKAFKFLRNSRALLYEKGKPQVIIFFAPCSMGREAPGNIVSPQIFLIFGGGSLCLQ